MTRITAPLTLLALILFPLLVNAQTSVSDSIDFFIKEKMRQRSIPALQLAIVRDGKLIKTAHYGTANLEHKIPTTAESMFYINSITKAFVGVAIMQLAEEGKLTVQDPISKYIDSLPPSWQQITLQQLLTHTSGLPDVIDEDEQVFPGGEQAVWKRVTALPVMAKPGDKFLYNQAGYVALGKIINKLSGMHFTKFIEERQFKPSGMKLARFGDSYDVIPNSAGAYTLNKMVDGNFIRVNTPGVSYIQFPLFYRTAAGIVSTATDMGNWIIALKSGMLLKKSSSLEIMFTPAILNNGEIGGFSALTNGYALGWPTVTRAEHPAVGPVGGGRNALFLYLKDDLSIVVLTNLMGSNPERFIDEIAGYYINDMHEANGFGLPIGIKKLRTQLLKQGFERSTTVLAALKKSDPTIELNEQDLNAWGYQLLGQKEPTKALAIFHLNAKLYPKSANTYDSLGETFEILEDRTAAIANYRKVLTLEPGNKNALARIKALEGK